MHQASVRETKIHLSRLLNQVLAGEDVVITRSGKPVARIVPIEENRPLFGVDTGRFRVPHSRTTTGIRSIASSSLRPGSKD